MSESGFEKVYNRSSGIRANRRGEGRDGHMFEVQRERFGRNELLYAVWSAPCENSPCCTAKSGATRVSLRAGRNASGSQRQAPSARKTTHAGGTETSPDNSAARATGNASATTPCGDRTRAAGGTATPTNCQARAARQA